MRPQPPDFDVAVRRSGETAQIVLEGEFDLSAVPRVEHALAALHDDGVTWVVMDLRGLQFIDSSGLNLLLELDAAARDNGHRVSVVPGGEHIRRLFELTGLADHFELVEPPSP
jgi:anti-sigma B factor antagonist